MQKVLEKDRTLRLASISSVSVGYTRVCVIHYQSSSGTDKLETKQKNDLGQVVTHPRKSADVRQ